MAKAKPKTETKAKASASAPSKSLMAKLKAKQKVLSRVRTDKAPSGFMKDEELIELFGLTVGKGQTVKVRLNKADLKEVDDQLIFELRFTVTEGKKQGTPISQAFWLNLDDDEQLEKDFKNICFALQKMGYDTDALTTEDLSGLAAELTEEKPYLILYISCYKGKTGKSKGKIKFSVRINGPYDPEASSDDDEEDEDSEEEDDEEEDSDESDEDEDEDDSEGEDEEDEEEEEEEPPKKTTKKSATTASKKAATKTVKSPSKKKDEEEEEYEDVEDEEEDEDSFDEDDPTTWVGFEAKIKPEGAKKIFKATCTKYDKKKKKLTFEDSNGDDHVITADEIKDWIAE
jgi:hypothetical protein